MAVVKCQYKMLGISVITVLILIFVRIAIEFMQLTRKN